MSECWKCKTEITLRSEEIKCDKCRKVVNFCCHKCHEWFSVADDDGEKREECFYCGFFFCPHCTTCGIGCDSLTHKDVVLKILNSQNEQDKKIDEIVKYFGKIKMGKENKSCLKGVPISYAKGRIKQCIVRMKGYRVNDNEDMKKFEERLEKVLDKQLGTLLTINQSREKGSYGQEFRDVFNYSICLGKLKIVEQKKIIDNEEVDYLGYKRVEEGHCPHLDLKDLIAKECPNKSCTIKSYPLSETTCVNPECKYKRGDKKGDLRILKLKISNQDTCQYPRNLFKKEGENGESKYS